MFNSTEAPEDGKGNQGVAGYCDAGTASSWQPWTALLSTVLYLCCFGSRAFWTSW